MIFLGTAVLVALLAATARALVRPSPARIIAAVVFAMCWPLVNRRWEGPVLWVPVPGHGLTLTDLITPVVPALLAGRALLARSRSRVQL